MKLLLKISCFLAIFLTYSISGYSRKSAAILIGNSAYIKKADGGVGDLGSSNIDIYQFKMSMSLFKMDTICYFLNVTKQQLSVQLPKCRESLRVRGITDILIYYTGHGFSIGYNDKFPEFDCWLGVDIDFLKNQIPKFESWSSNKELKELLNSNSCKEVLSGKDFGSFVTLTSYLNSAIPIAWISEMFSSFNLCIISDACRSRIGLLPNAEYFDNFINNDSSVFNKWKPSFEIKKNEATEYKQKFKKDLHSYISYFTDLVDSETIRNIKYINGRYSNSKKDSLLTIYYATQYPFPAKTGEFQSKFSASLLRIIDEAYLKAFSLQFNKQLEEVVTKTIESPSPQKPKIVLCGNSYLPFDSGVAKLKYSVKYLRDFKPDNDTKIVDYSIYLDSAESYKGRVKVLLDTMLCEKGYLPSILEIFCLDKRYKISYSDKPIIDIKKFTSNINIFVSKIDPIQDTLIDRKIDVKIFIIYQLNKPIWGEKVVKATNLVKFRYGKTFEMDIPEFTSMKLYDQFLISDVSIICAMKEFPLLSSPNVFLKSQKLKFESNGLINSFWDADKQKLIITIKNPDQ